MKREILFRGLTVDGKWAYGNLITSSNGEAHILSANSNPIIKENSRIGYWYLNSPCYKVIPETVGQYTGLTDKNGTKIFEGDLVLCDSNRTCEVVWFEHNGQWDLNFVKELEITPKWTFFSFNDVKKRAEVIGNIYETK